MLELRVDLCCCEIHPSIRHAHYYTAHNITQTAAVLLHVRLTLVLLFGVDVLTRYVVVVGRLTG